MYLSCYDVGMKINVTDASKIFKVSRPTIYAMQGRNEIPVPVTDMGIMEYLQEREEELQNIRERLGIYMSEA